MKIVICDDDKDFSTFLESRILSYCRHRNLFVDIVKYNDAKFLLESNIILDNSVIFLDVSMPHIDGIQAGQLISKKYPKSIIVYVSNLIEYAPISHEINNAIRYLLKSNLDATFDECMSYVLQCLNYQNKKVTIHFIEGEIILYRNDILYVDCVGHLITVHFISKKKDPLSTRKYTLNTIHKILGEDLFVRIDQSYIVNMAHIDSFIRYTHGIKCLLNDGTEINVSQRRAKEANRKFFKYKGSI